MGSQCLLNRDSVSVWEEEEVLKVLGVGVAQQWERTGGCRTVHVERVKVVSFTSRVNNHN